MQPNTYWVHVHSIVQCIKINSLKKVFGEEEDEVHAFGPVDISIKSGEFVSVLGPSGCGKSTLMLMMAGLLGPKRGNIFFDGESVGGPKNDIGIMFQDNTLVPWRTVEGNIKLQLELRNLDINQYKNKILNILKSVKLEDFSNRYPSELSGGMQQRAAFCQAMIHEPNTILLDEPLGKLDAMTREKIRSSNGMWWSPNYSLHELFIPDYLVIFGGNLPIQKISKNMLSSLRYFHKNGSKLIAVDTGAFSLAEAGIISKNTKICLHWEAKKNFIERYPFKNITDEKYVLNDNGLYFSAGGVSILDLFLKIISFRP